MAFKFNKAVIVSLLLVACSGPNDDEKFKIGTPIEQVDAQKMQLFEENGASYFYSFDSAGRRINFVDPSGGSLAFSSDLGSGQNGQAWLASTKDSYAFSLQGGTVSLYSPRTGGISQILKLPGTVNSYAADFPQGYVAFVDEFFSIGLLKLSADGEVLGQWTGGPIFEGQQTIVSGEMIDGGKLVLATNQGNLFVVDVDASIQAESWVFNSLAPGFTNPSWVGRVEGREDRVLVHDQRRLSLVDLSSQTILDSNTVSQFASTSKNGRDHVYYYESSSGYNVIVSTKDGESLTDDRVKVNADNNISSYLSETSVVILTRDNEIMKIRLEDGLVQGSYSNRADARVGLSEGFAVSMYDSPLGYIEVLNLDSGAKTEFKAFNLSVLQR